jgi:hypothetical protein
MVPLDAVPNAIAYPPWSPLPARRPHRRRHAKRTASGASGWKHTRSKNLSAALVVLDRRDPTLTPDKLHDLAAEHSEAPCGKKYCAVEVVLKVWGKLPARSTLFEHWPKAPEP